MGFDQPFRDGQTEADASGPTRPIRAPGAGVLAEQVRQLLGRHAPALVGYRHRNVDAVAHRSNVDGGRLGSVPGRVRKEVVEHLDDPTLVRQHPGQIQRQVDADGLPAAAVHERGPGLLHQGGHLHGLGVDRQRARVDAPRIEQVG